MQTLLNEPLEYAVPEAPASSNNGVVLRVIALSLFAILAIGGAYVYFYPSNRAEVCVTRSGNMVCYEASH